MTQNNFGGNKGKSKQMAIYTYVHLVAVLISLADKTKPWTSVAGACVEHPHLFFNARQIHFYIFQ